MKELLLFAAGMAFVVLTSGAAIADEPAGNFLFSVCVPDCIKKRCCDDYCAKPLPKTSCAKISCCNNYCAKPEPCPKCIKKTCCDDYCRKPIPCVKCPPQNCDKLKCSTPGCAGQK